MEYTTQNQDERYVSRRQYRRNLMRERIEKFLKEPAAEEYTEHLYPDEAEWLERKYPEVSFVFPDKKIYPTKRYTCIVKKKKMPKKK